MGVPKRRLKKCDACQRLFGKYAQKCTHTKNDRVQIVALLNAANTRLAGGGKIAGGSVWEAAAQSVGSLTTYLTTSLASVGTYVSSVSSLKDLLSMMKEYLSKWGYALLPRIDGVATVAERGEFVASVNRFMIRNRSFMPFGLINSTEDKMKNIIEYVRSGSDKYGHLPKDLLVKLDNLTARSGLLTLGFNELMSFAAAAGTLSGGASAMKLFVKLLFAGMRKFGVIKGGDSLQSILEQVGRLLGAGIATQWVTASAAGVVTGPIMFAMFAAVELYNIGTGSSKGVIGMALSLMWNATVYAANLLINTAKFVWRYLVPRYGKEKVRALFNPILKWVQALVGFGMRAEAAKKTSRTNKLTTGVEAKQDELNAVAGDLLWISNEGNPALALEAEIDVESTDFDERTDSDDSDAETDDARRDAPSSDEEDVDEEIQAKLDEIAQLDKRIAAMESAHS